MQDQQEFSLWDDTNHPGMSEEDWKKLNERNLTPEEQAQKIQDELAHLKGQLNSLYEQLLPYTNPKDMQLAKPPSYRDKYPELFEKPDMGSLPDLWWNDPRVPPGPSGPMEEVLGDRARNIDPYKFQDMLMKLRRGRKNI